MFFLGLESGLFLSLSLCSPGGRLLALSCAVYGPEGLMDTPQCSITTIWPLYVFAFRQLFSFPFSFFNTLFIYWFEWKMISVKVLPGYTTHSHCCWNTAQPVELQDSQVLTIQHVTGATGFTRQQYNTCQWHEESIWWRNGQIKCIKYISMEVIILYFGGYVDFFLCKPTG